MNAPIKIVTVPTSPAIVKAPATAVASRHDEGPRPRALSRKRTPTEREAINGMATIHRTLAPWMCTRLYRGCSPGFV